MIPKKSLNPVIMLGDKDFIVTEDELDYIVELHNGGWHYEMIAKEMQRDPIEILIALLHVAEQNKKDLRALSFAPHPKPQELGNRRGAESIVQAKVIKTKEKKPTVIEIDGDRFVYDPENIRR